MARTNEPKPYNLDDPTEIDRLIRELTGYMRVSCTHGTDTEGRTFAYLALRDLEKRTHLARQGYAITDARTALLPEHAAP